MLSTLVSSLPPASATDLYRRIAGSLSSALFDRLLVNRTWSASGGAQFKYDFEQGFLSVGKTVGIQRGVERGWELLQGSAIIIALPASVSSNSTKGGISFTQVMQLAFDDSASLEDWNRTLDALNIDEEIMGRAEVTAVLRRRPECWR